MSVQSIVEGLFVEVKEVPDISALIPSNIEQALNFYGFENEEGMSLLQSMMVAYQAAIFLIPSILDYYTKRANEYGIEATKHKYTDRLKGILEFQKTLEDLLNQIRRSLGYASEGTLPNPELVKVEEDDDFYQP